MYILRRIPKGCLCEKQRTPDHEGFGVGFRGCLEAVRVRCLVCWWVDPATLHESAVEVSPDGPESVIHPYFIEGQPAPQHLTI